MEKTKNNTWEFLWYALYTFAGLGVEIALIGLVEPLIFKGFNPNKYTNTQLIVHWILTCIALGFVSYLIITRAKKKLGFQIINNNKVEKRQIVIALVIVCIAIGMNALDWGTLKIIGEAQKKVPVIFFFQYVYYFFEVVLICLIISLGQKFFESLLQKDSKVIPWGGLLLSVTWGAIHFLTKGSLVEGLGTMLFGILAGFIYLVLNRNTKWTYIAIAMAFMI